MRSCACTRKFLLSHFTIGWMVRFHSVKFFREVFLFFIYLFLLNILLHGARANSPTYTRTYTHVYLLVYIQICIMYMCMYEIKRIGTSIYAFIRAGTAAGKMHAGEDIYAGADVPIFFFI